MKSKLKKYFQFNTLSLGHFSAAWIIAGKICRDFSILEEVKNTQGEATDQLTENEKTRFDSPQEIITCPARVKLTMS